MTARLIRESLDILETEQASVFKCGCENNHLGGYRTRLSEDSLLEFEEFMTSNGGSVVELGHTSMVIVNGQVTRYTSGGSFSIPGLNIKDVDIIPASVEKQIRDAQKQAGRSGPSRNKPSVDDYDDTDDGAGPYLQNNTNRNRTGQSVVADYDNVNDVAIKKDVGAIDVVFRVNVPDSLRSKILAAAQFANGVFKEQGLGWVGNSTVYVECHHPDQTAGRYYAGNDKLVLNDHDTGHIKHTMVHEFGHRFHYQCNNSASLNAKVLDAYQSWTSWDYYPTEYSRKNHYEWFAECWTYWLFNQFAGYPHAKWFVSLIRNHNR